MSSSRSPGAKDSPAPGKATERHARRRTEVSTSYELLEHGVGRAGTLTGGSTVVRWRSMKSLLAVVWIFQIARALMADNGR